MTDEIDIEAAIARLHERTDSDHDDDFMEEVPNSGDRVVLEIDGGPDLAGTARSCDRMVFEDDSFAGYFLTFVTDDGRPHYARTDDDLRVAYEQGGPMGNGGDSVRQPGDITRVRIEE